LGNRWDLEIFPVENLRFPQWTEGIVLRQGKDRGKETLIVLLSKTIEIIFKLYY